MGQNQGYQFVFVLKVIFYGFDPMVDSSPLKAGNIFVMFSNHLNLSKPKVKRNLLS